MSFCLIYLKISVFMIQCQATGIYLLLHRKDSASSSASNVSGHHYPRPSKHAWKFNSSSLFVGMGSDNIPSHLSKTCCTVAWGGKFAFRTHFYCSSPWGMSGEVKPAEGLWRTVDGCFSGIAWTSVKE